MSETFKQLPEGWIHVKLKEIFFSPKPDIVDGPFGSNLKASEYVDTGVPIIRLQNIDRCRFINKNIRFITIEKSQQLQRHSFSPGDIVVTKLGAPLGKACLVPTNFGPGIIVADVVRLNSSNTLCSSSYIVYAINSSSVIQSLEQYIKGTTRPRVNLDNIRDIEIPLPPLAEQKRIVTKVDELMSSIKRAKSHFERVLGIMENFRKAVLDAAFLDRLTEDWRNKLEKSEQWNEVNFFDFCVLQRGYDLPIRKCKPGSYPVVSSSGIVAHHSEFKAKGPGVTVGRSGSTGKVHYVEEDFWPHNTALFVKDFKGNLPKYVYYYLLGFSFQRFSASTAVPTLNRNALRGVKVRVPPFYEQVEIVRQVERLFDLSNSIERRVKTATEKTEKLTQSILSKAFRGELVPTEAELAKIECREYETAKELLDRIAKAKSTEANDKEKKQMKRQLSVKHKKQPVRYPLLEVIRKNPEGITPENLLRIANYTIEEIDDFYFDLSNIMQDIEEVKPSGSQAKKWLINNNVLIKPKKV